MTPTEHRWRMIRASIEGGVAAILVVAVAVIAYLIVAAP